MNSRWYEVDYYGHKPTLKQRFKTFWALKFERSWNERYKEWRNMKP
jgi:ABC-type transport system involved in cytochrome c biogenesis ATPase subunit